MGMSATLRREDGIVYSKEKSWVPSRHSGEGSRKIVGLGSQSEGTLGQEELPLGWPLTYVFLWGLTPPPKRQPDYLPRFGRCLKSLPGFDRGGKTNSASWF